MDDTQKPETRIIDEFHFIITVSTVLESVGKCWEIGYNAQKKLMIDIQEYVTQEELHSLQQFITAIQH